MSLFPSFIFCNHTDSCHIADLIGNARASIRISAQAFGNGIVAGKEKDGKFEEIASE